MEEDLLKILREYWGHEAFRPLQEEIISAVLDNKDTLAILPTGGGKSLCFQVPAMVKEGLCLVISPLIALMKDQVENLSKREIPALAIYSGMSFTEARNTLQQAISGKFKFLYVSPERLETALFREFLPGMDISIIAVDEAHCISQWGHDFRPSYLRIANLRKELPGIPVIALTASATLPVQADICLNLSFKNKKVFRQSFIRPNLSYSCFNPASKQTRLLEIIQKVPGSSIVYCKSRKQTQQICELLQMHGVSADYYHAGLNNEQRTMRQKNWLHGTTRVIVCTNAFGMGIDKPDVRTVVHYDVPECLENYYQEAGRAGRDGLKAYAVLLYQEHELSQMLEQVDLRFPTLAALKETYVALMNFLQIPAGAGEWQSYDFDLAMFAENFKLNILQATYGIQALSKEGLFTYNEVFFKPSTLTFSCDRQQVEDVEKRYPELEPVIKGLLRSYEGIFDYPVTIYESRLAQFLKINIPEVKDRLLRLHKYGIVQYDPQKDSPQLLLMQNRMYADSFKMDAVAHLERKEAYRQRINAIVEFIKETAICRSNQLGIYFGDADTVPCNICDNCLHKKNQVLPANEFKKISNDLQNMLLSGQVHIEQIEMGYKGPEKEKLWKVIDFLNGENKIKTDDNGYVSLVK